jgi:tetratricopeptide (TPR) repeat protein
VLSDSRNTGVFKRADFQARTRTVPNKVYASYLEALAAGDDVERIDILLKTVDLYRDFPQASFQLGYYYYQKGDIARAIQYLKPALHEAQDFLEAQFMLGTCFLKQDNLMEAIASYNAFLARKPALEAYNNIGVAYLRRGDYPLAVQNLIEARKFARDDLTVALNLALLRHVDGDEPAALVLLEELVKTHADQGMVHYLYSVALAARGETQKAQAAAAQAVKLGIDAEKMKNQDPRGWAWIFPSWTRRPAGAGPGGAAAGSGDPARYRH